MLDCKSYKCNIIKENVFEKQLQQLKKKKSFKVRKISQIRKSVKYKKTQ